jgi:raffinose/stachyose/melibiose transport system substrate-binding protein
MKNTAPPGAGEPISRRSFLLRTGGAGLGVGLLSLGICGRQRAQAEDQVAYAGELVLVSQSGATPDKALPKLLDAFKAANPGITTKVVLYPEEKFVALYSAARAAGEQIDVLVLNGQDVRRYATAGSLLDFEQVTFKDRFLPEALKPFTMRDKLWGVPSGAAGGFLIFMNKALLTKLSQNVPKTYDELKRVAEILRKNGVSPFTHPGKVIYMWPVWFFTTFAQASNNRAIDRTIEILTGKGKFTDPDVVQALDLVFQFGRDKMFSPATFGLDFSGAQSEIQTGKACFYLFHDSIAKPLMEAQSENFALDYMLMPNLVGKQVASQYPGGPGVVLTLPSDIDPKRKAAALHLIDFLTSDNADQQSVALNGGAVPVNKGVAPEGVPVYAKEKEDISKMVTYLDWLYPPEITKGMQEGLQAGLLGKTTAEALGKSLQDTLERLIAGGYKFAT